MKYVSVIVDNNTNATDELYTYACESDDIKVGNRVDVPFSKSNRTAKGFVAAITDTAPEGIKRFKKVISIDPDFSLTEENINTIVWMHKRYACRYIEAVRCFISGDEIVKRKTKDPFEDLEAEPTVPEKLTKEQQKAYDSIAESLDKKVNDSFLLFGVTGSGKTEVYLQAMQKCLDQGRSGIVLVPEISLTPQTIARFVGRFGKENIAIFHSKLTVRQRAVEYKKIKEGKVKLVIGVRSAIFAPFDDIGLIIMDEEHETSYKSDQSPKYDCMEVALKRAMQHKAVLILGSATPSVSDHYRAKKGIFKELRLSERYNKTPLPKVDIIDMRDEVRAGNKSLFSSKLIHEMKRCFDDKKQVILFLNRRGYSSFVSCRECGYTMSCPECGISMTYHKSRGEMVCHYCGRTAKMPKICPECGSRIIGRFGAGTEQVEEKAKELFPDKSIERLDFDTARKKGSAQKILSRFEKGKTDILIGTQLVAKGIDVANVGLVGVISADVSLNIPDYRSAERSFQLVTQAAGRSGRGTERGTVIVQSYNPDHPALLAAAKHDYEDFYRSEIKIRELAAYPPFTDIFQLILSSEKEEKAIAASEKLFDHLRKLLPEDYIMLGPSKAPLHKAAGQYRYQIIIKSPAGMRGALSDTVNSIKRGWKDDALLTVDINPYSLI